MYHHHFNFYIYKDLFILIKAFREKTLDDIIIYTGYNKNEIPELILKNWNILELSPFIALYCNPIAICVLIIEFPDKFGVSILVILIGLELTVCCIYNLPLYC